MTENKKTVDNTEEMSSNFIHTMIEKDIAEDGDYAGMKVHTRFPPEPNGYLHIGHAKAICINFGTALKFGGVCNLRMDDTNPTKEDVEYVDAIQEDIRWLGFDWEDRFYYASEYFDKMYDAAVELIKKGLAYICELTPEQMREYRGDLSTPAKSPYRDRPIEESLALFEKMKNGEVEDGKMTLRAKIDLASGNFNMRDPVIYTITAPATSGASTRCTTSPTRSRTRWSTSPTACAASSSRITDRCTTGCATTSPCRASRARSSSRDWASTTRSCQSVSSARWSRRAMSADGMIRVCPPSAACADAATRRNRSAISATASA